MSHHLDASAIVKLVVPEAESDALRAWLGRLPSRPASSDLARTEVLRTVRRYRPDLTVDADTVLESIRLQIVGRDMFRMAGSLGPPTLRSLDAIHLSCTLNLRAELESIVTYDDRLAEAARHHGIRVSATA